ncbi:hypothetical protein [Piscinibacter sp. XHJ-5]|uniref:hypothetical protein n=1 Tax=Piscinibacter sp. XHJ-5 TaxID=3037797 RepID=UPI00245302D9|nr:hypothetical protein [Piscinibacter sp. XHJ-5]
MNDEDSEDEWAAEAAEEAADTERKKEPPPAIGNEEFLAWRSPRVVTGGPVRLDNPLWHWLVRTRHSGYSANAVMQGPSSSHAGPVWCFDRFGKSETTLQDGRVVHVGGEHEDYYDADFHIYNDVVVIDRDGSIAINGYSPDVFPPTDFHSATLVGGAIFIIGCLGYRHQRTVGSTPVFRLQTDTMIIGPVATSGEAPGWIHGHMAQLAEDGGTIVVRGGELWLGNERTMQENIDAWSLNTATGVWTRLTTLDWQRWTMVRKDRRRNRLWDTRQERWNHDHPSLSLQSHWKHAEAPDFDALDALYRLEPAATAPEQGAEHNVFLTQVDGLTVRFKEDAWSVQAMVEGRLSDMRLGELQRATVATLEKLDASEWEIEPG